MKIKFILYLISLIIIVSSISALEYTVEVNSPNKVNVYQGDISDDFSLTITNNGGYCDILCTWTTNAGSSDAEIKVPQDGGSKTINFESRADGTNGFALNNIQINCDRDTEPLNCFSSPDSQTETFSFNYLWDGDGVCTTSKEKCENYFDGENSYLKDSSCTCSEITQCNPSSERGADNKGCATYCGNNVKESQYENCSNCPDDVGKCDGYSCNLKSECEGDYCVHNKCSHIPYIKGDTYCDSNVGENCLNSPSDCVCQSNERCNNQGKCETYCGNNICESSEQGICKADCEWCGDGVCDENKETCKGCSEDCGECEKTQEEEKITEQITDIKKQVEESAQKNIANKKIMNIIAGSIIVTIILILIGWSVFRYMKKSNKEITKKEKKCSKCGSRIKDKSKFCHECGNKIE